MWQKLGNNFSIHGQKFPSWDEDLLKEGEYLAAIAKNIAVKVPLTPDGLKACRKLRENNILVNVTLCFSAGQALLAAKAGASFISPFVGRLDDMMHR